MFDIRPRRGRNPPSSALVCERVKPLAPCLAVALLVGGAWSYVRWQQAAPKRLRNSAPHPAAGAAKPVPPSTSTVSPAPVTPYRTVIAHPPPTLPIAEAAPRIVPAGTEASRRHRAALQRLYGPFFAERNLSPEQVERLLELLILHAETREAQAASASGTAAGVHAIRHPLNAALLDELRPILGEEGVAAYDRFQALSYYRLGYVERFTPAFAAAQAALSPEQKDRLAALLADHDRPGQKTSTDVSHSSRIDWDAVLPPAAAFLSPAQQAALHSAFEAQAAPSR